MYDQFERRIKKLKQCYVRECSMFMGAFVSYGRGIIHDKVKPKSSSGKTHGCGSCLIFYCTDGLVVVASSRSHPLFLGLCAPAIWYLCTVILVCLDILTRYLYSPIMPIIFLILLF